MDIGTGKDRHLYGDIPYHLIDICDAGTAYDVSQYLQDFEIALAEIRQKGQQPILCGGTGFYIQSALQGLPYAMVPVNSTLRENLERLDKTALQQQLDAATLPLDFQADTSTKKRMIRALEIAEWTAAHPQQKTQRRPSTPEEAILFGINPDTEVRRQRITERLQFRLQNGLIEEVANLLGQGIPPEKLVYYGLEYKYVTLYLQGELDKKTLFTKLNTEIHRYAKRQMTYFRKMEKDGLPIIWADNPSQQDMLASIQNRLLGTIDQAL